MDRTTQSEDADMAGQKQGGILASMYHFFHRNRLGELLVLRGKLTPKELRELLARQRSENRPLGEILVAAQVISQGELKFALAMQSTFRVVAATIALGSIITITSKQALAGAIKDIPAKISLVSAAAFSGIGHYPALFGAEEKRSGDLSAFTKWESMFNRFHSESASSHAQGPITKWKQDLSALQGLPLETMVEKVNAMMNRVPYINDSKNWGKSDYWATPVEFMNKGGDCEDFAIAKYSSLRALGVPEDRMRIAIVKDMQKGIPHAILVVYTDSGPMILDNQIKSVRRADSISHYKPIFSINRTAWWLHTAPTGRSVNTVVAAAK